MKKQELEQRLKAQSEKIIEFQREMEIEAALEGIRAKALAMRTSDDLLEVSKVMREQMGKLGQAELESAIVHIYPENAEALEAWYVYRAADDTQGKFVTGKAIAPYTSSWYTKETIKKYNSSEKEYTIVSNKKRLIEWYGVLEQIAPATVDYDDNGKMIIPEVLYYHYSKFSGGALLMISNERPSEEAIELQGRAAQVFELAYRRYLDLQKAEAQTREAQIEAALERVRAKSMAMHKSEELAALSLELVKQVQALGVATWFCAFNIYDDDPKGSLEWGSNGQGTFPKYRTPREGIFLRYYEAGKRGETLLINEIDEDECPAHYEYLCTLPGVGEQLLKMKESGISFPDSQIDHVAFFKYGYILFITYEPTPESHHIFKRFAKVFEQTYTRFLDLQKAETQAREAKIEAAMERIRSRAIAMRSSDELMEVALEIRIQTDMLGQQDLELSVVHLYEEDAPYFESMAAMRNPGSEGEITTHRMKFPVDATPKIEQMMNNYWAGLSQYTITLDFHEREEWQRVLERTVPELFDKRLQFDEDAIANDIKEYWNFADFSGGSLLTVTYSPPTRETKELFRRASDVFDLAYKRYKDLKKAEAQAREAQVEASLERVRSRTMAMHKSEELLDAADILSKELVRLEIPHFMSGFVLINEKTEKQDAWMGVPQEESKVNFNLPLEGDAILRKRYEFWKKQEAIFHHMVKGKQLSRHLDFVVKHFNSDEAASLSETMPDPIVFYCANFKEGYLHILSKEFLSDEQENTLVRFTKAFQQTYTRFLDLKKAEAQAREAQIEAALERVRSRSMAMHKSEEMLSVIEVVSEQLIQLKLNFDTVSFGKNNQQGDFKFWLTSTGQPKPVLIEVPPFDNPVQNTVKEAKEKGLDFIADVFTQKENKKWSQHLIKYSVLQFFPQPVKDFILNAPGFARSSFLLKNIDLYVGNYRAAPFTKEENSIFRRFAQVFDQAYTRFLDLEKAEEQAREAIKQASVDRVRGEISSMRSTADLKRITPLIWNELTVLGVPFIRCGVFIIDEENAKVEAHLSDPGGHSLGVMHLPFDTNELTRKSVENWRNKKVYKAHWDKEAFVNWTKTLKDLGHIKNVATYQGAAKPPESLHLHFVPFTQGMLYVGSENSLDDDQIALVHSLADAFAIAYARYEDFTQLERAKERVETTLNELKTTQNQLVQSEKMASLGELTAGIAHEIKNPLNFVNNFSEVSGELLEEMNEELDIGNFEEARNIAADLKQNLERILDHGKRADSIVKGMLQHSRSSSGVKELTDINALADEYLRLAYHGLRAKDKTFNAGMKTYFDESIGKVNVVPQDIGRVILNLITNAFYEVSAKALAKMDSQNPETLKGSKVYQPTVSVSTKRTNDHITISVKDNGNGIPKKIVNKIFQPFFTTKPTGKGTGLGLSLSYDIVKAHGGEFKVQTKEGAGTEFMITLKG